MDIYRMAARGGRMMKPASPAMFRLMPRKMTTAETIQPLAPPRKFCIRETRKPLFSATEEPITATSTMPRGAKPEKLVITLLHRYWIPQMENRFCTLTTSWVAGFRA